MDQATLMDFWLRIVTTTMNINMSMDMDMTTTAMCLLPNIRKTKMRWSALTYAKT